MDWVRDRQPYVCMYVHHAFGMQLRLSACASAMATLFVVHAFACVCMHALQVPEL